MCSARVDAIYKQQLAKKTTKPETKTKTKTKTKTVTHTIAVPKTKIVKQPTPQQTVPKDTERADFALIRLQLPLPNQQGNRDKH